MPVGGAVDAFDIFAGALRHEAGVERHEDFEVAAGDLFVAEAELYGLGQGVDHVFAVVVEDEDIGARVQHRGDVLREVAGAERCPHFGDGVPAEAFGDIDDGAFL